MVKEIIDKATTYLTYGGSQMTYDRTEVKIEIEYDITVGKKLQPVLYEIMEDLRVELIERGFKPSYELKEVYRG